MPDSVSRPVAEFPGVVWTSFDRYGRYGAIARAVRASLGPGRHRVLDVGDGAGYLTAFDADLDLLCVDLAPAEDPLPGTRRLAADGARLPVRDAAFDAVVSCDALEHVPAEHRPAFLRELARVSRDVVVVAAPFATVGVTGAEELARRYALLTTGAPQDQLEEHAERGLPELDAARAELEAAGLSVVVHGNGNLHDWLLLMMLKHQLLARPALLPLDASYDMAYNLTLSGRNDVPPFYRHVLVARRADRGEPRLGTPPAGFDASPPDTVALLSGWLAATAAEATRQDTVPELHGLHHRVSALEARLVQLEETSGTLVVRADDTTARLIDLRELLEHVYGLIRHPLRSVTGRARRRSDAEE
jgi:SAM-dependent methyltransferase